MQFYYYYYRRENDPQPRLSHRAGTIYVDTHVGVLARLDAETGSLDWGYGYRTAPVQSPERFFYYYQPQEPMAAGSPPLGLGDGEAMLIKGSQSSRLYALDPNRMTVLWERPVSKDARLLGVGDRAVFLGGDEISALDLRTRELLWATRVPGGSLEGRTLVAPDGLWQLTNRGIFEIDPATGEVRRIFRGEDLGAVGGDLFLTDRWLLAVSNRKIAAYSRRGNDAAPAAANATAKERASDE
jgi:outer membrane protein assembly factor BamB